MEEGPSSPGWLEVERTSAYRIRPTRGGGPQSDIRGDYRFREAYVEGLGDNIESDEFYASEQRVGLEAGYLFSNGLKAYASVTNLTDEPQILPGLSPARRRCEPVRPQIHLWCRIKFLIGGPEL